MTIAYVGELITQEFIDELNADLAAAYAASYTPPSRLVTSGGTVAMTDTDYEVVIAKTVGSATTVLLPPGKAFGSLARVSDGKGDAFTNNISVQAAGSGKINGSTSSILVGDNWGSALFRSMGQETGTNLDLWSVLEPNTMQFVPGSSTPVGYQQIASFATLQTLTVPAGARFAEIYVSGNACRYRDDGTNPTASVGFPLVVGTNFEYTGSLGDFAIIPETGSATIDVVYYG